ncbi:MAG: type II toxin-antitoxin system VapC family toxin [Candidatus Marinimicrobia bacterium]|nr:type II toxin-antitoxin system VapC family toxin [Candidatus Neomarinimicrobiota bacterium]
MKLIVIDTNIYSLAMKNDSMAVKILRQAEKIYICSIVIGELLSGFKFGIQERKNMKLFNEFLDSPRVIAIDITENTAIHYSQIYLDLKKAGTPLPTNDMWIAAVAKEKGAYLATADKHFQFIPGLLLQTVGVLE